MTSTDRCRGMREGIGSLALGQLGPADESELRVHLEGCPACRREYESLARLAALMPASEPELRAPAPPPGLGDRIADAIETERHGDHRRRFARRGAMAAAAAAAAVVALVLVTSGGTNRADPDNSLAFTGGAAGVLVSGKLDPTPLGTQIHMRVEGVRSGTLCRVFLQREDGSRSFAGTFRYRDWNGREAPPAILSSALDLARVDAVGVKAANRTFVIPVGAISAGKEGEET